MLEKDPQLFFFQNLGKLIKEKRTLKKISQDDLAKAVSLSRVSIVNIEKGIQKVQVHTLVQMSNILDFDLNGLKNLAVEEMGARNLDKNYQNRIEKSEVNNQKILKKIFPDLQKHL